MSKKNKRKFNGEVLKNLRIEHGFNTTQDLFLAIHHKTGTTIVAQSIENHETGINEPRLTAILEYAKFFNVDPTVFFQFNEQDESPINSNNFVQQNKEQHENL